MKKVSLVVPTYNERRNIPPLLERIDSTLKSHEYEYEIIVVDDDSPDETWKAASEYSNKYPVKVVRRENEKGLATAVVKGIEESNHDLVVTMDADLQHPPEKIPELISEIENGSDIAVGSRFVKGGNVKEFGFFRKLMSKGADFIARILFRETRKIKDTQSGFFAFKKKVIKNSDLNPCGYKILLEILVQGNYNKVSEVGYEFGHRKSGESKLGTGSVFSYLRHMFRLSIKSGEAARFAKFCIVGGGGTIVNLAIIYSLTTSGLFYLFSGAIAREVALFFNFFMNKAWTFSDRKIKGFEILKALGRDHVVRSGGIILNIAFLGIFTEFFGFHYLISQLIGIGAAATWNFSGNKLWTWGY